MRNDTQTLDAARAGYRGEPCAFLFSSSLWLAYQAGRTLQMKGQAAPTKAHGSRGYSVRVMTGADSEFVVSFAGDALDRVTLERKFA